MRLALRARTTAALMTAAALSVTVLAGASPAEAGPPAVWTRLTTSHGLTGLTEARLVRFHGALQVFWTQTDAASSTSIRVRSLSSAGKPAQATRTVVSGWATLINEPSPIIENGQLLLAFGGIHSGDPYDKFSGAITYASSIDGVTWTLGDGALSEHRDYLDNGTGAVDDAGTPVVAFAPTTVNRVSLHRGIDPSFPAATPDTYTSPTPGGVGDINLARDSKTGEIWAAWYSLGNSSAGLYYQQVYPSVGPLVELPGAALPYQQIAMAARVGGGVYIGYTVGDPIPTKVRLVKAGSPAHQDISAPGAVNLALAAGPGGRVWLAWRRNQGATLTVVRTNTTVSRFGPAVPVASPTTYGIGHVAVNGPTGPLDVVVSATTGKPLASYVALFHTQVRAPLSVALSRHSVASATGGKVVATVTDAGQPVAGAKVTLGGVSVRTNGQGRATITVKPRTHKGKVLVGVSQTSYASTTLPLTIG
ncbi:hypothetical protein acdb102_37420 [Acidothermaceae bacterium B102]|nr:hypothetical protein acdb102_37420 [Acidothermaceae bacterium B102]